MADAQSVIRAIVAIEPAGEGPYKNITQEQGEYIAGLFDGDFSLFQELDERPGRYVSPHYHGDYEKGSSAGYDSWHYKLRQARNSCDEFFNILNK